MGKIKLEGNKKEDKRMLGNSKKVERMLVGKKKKKIYKFTINYF